MKNVVRTFTLWALFLTAAGVSAHDWSFLAGDVRRETRFNMHSRVLARTEVAPTRFRVLVPALLDPPIRFLERFMPYEKSFGRVYAAFYLFAMAGMLYALFAYLRIHFTDEQSLIGALAVAATMPMALRAFDWAPYSQLEPTLFALALILMYRRRHLWLGIVIAVATLNRETAIFMVFLFVVVFPLTTERLRTAAVYLAIWATVFFGLRWAFGAGPPVYFTLETLWYGNTHELNQIVISFVNLALLYGAFWVFAILGYRRAPSFIRRSALIVPPYLLVVGAWGIWTEARLLQPLYPIIVPLGLSFLFTPRGAEISERGVLQ